MNKIKSVFSMLILISTIVMVILQSVVVGVNGDRLGKIEKEDDIKIMEAFQVTQPKIEPIINPKDTVSERVKQSRIKVVQKELIKDFSPLEDIRINEYESHLLTEAEVTELKLKVGVREPNKNYNLLFNGLGTGLAPPTAAEWDAMVGNVEVVESPMVSSFPGSLDHSTSTYFPPVRSQASQGSCAAWATTYYTATYAQSKDNGWTQTSSGNNNQILSPAWTYNKANYGYDSGSYTWTNYYILADIGGATWSTMPYDQYEDLYWGSETAWREAPQYRFDKMKWTYPQEIDVLKSWLNDGFVLPLALDAYEYSNLGSGDNIISSSEYDSTTANHANTIVGYDDNKTADGDIGAFKIVNSWGSSWGSSWDGFGYYWMTYKAFAELTNPVIMFYDKIDYEPTLLATWNITGSCSREADITVGVGDPSLPNGSVTPFWRGGTHDLPKFMCLDITEFVDSVGLSSFFLEVASEANNGSISSFKLELYENGYVINGSSLKSQESPEVTKTNPCSVNNSISGFQLKIEAPDEGQWYKGIIQSTGVAQEPVAKTVLHEDFETDFPGDWVVGDSDSRHGIDTWGASKTRDYQGFRSGWCAAVAEPIFEEAFDSNDSLPDGWITYSEGPDNHKWNVTNTGYPFTYDGDDNGAVCDNNFSGPGGNITEWLYMDSTSSFNTSEYSDILLEFFLDYKYYDGDEFAQVLYATDSAYPTFTVLKTWTASSFGSQKLDFSAAAGKNEVYLAFRYHGTNDSYMFIDDVKVIYNSTGGEYDDHMDSYMYHSVDLSDFDKVNLSYEYWLDSESGFDSLFVLYSQDSSWYFVDEHNGSSGGWKKSYTLIPANATHIGFHFSSDSSESNYEGAYVDNVSLVGYNNITSIEGRLDTFNWATATGTTNWNISIDTTKYSDGQHDLAARAKYGTNFSYDYRSFKIDNTQPNTFTPVATPSTWTSTQPVITFSTSDSASGVDYYQLQIDSDGFSNQTSPYTLPSLSDGTHTVTVRSFDMAGNFRAGTVNVYIDSGLPNSFSVNANPNDWTTNTQPIITFSTTDATSGIDHYSVKIGAGGFSDQTSPYTMPSQTDGTYVVTVRAYDRANNYREGNVNVYIDTTPPSSFAPTANPSGWSPITQPVISFSTIDSTSGIDHYSVKIDSGSFLAQSSPYTLPVQSDGIHDVTVRAYDKAGNYVDGLVKVYVDTTLPNPFTPQATPSSWTVNTQPIITFFTTDSTSGIDYYKLKVDDGTFENQTSPYTLPPQTDGIHTITVRAYNNAGKYIDGFVNVYIDTHPPNPFIPVAIPNNWTNSQPVIVFDTSDPTSGIDLYQVRIDVGGFNNQTSPYTLPYLEEGQHMITVRAVDYAGNYVDGNVNVYLDLTSPEPFDINATPATSTWTNNMPELSFSAEDNLSGIDFYKVQIGTGDFILQTSPYKLPMLTDGMNMITVRAYDLAGNHRDSKVVVYIDTTPPEEFLPIATPSSWTNSPIAIYFATYDEISEIDHYKVRIDNDAFTTQTSPYTLPNLLDGAHNVTVRAIDLAGNYIEGMVQVFIDTIKPNLILNQSIDDIWYNQSSIVLSWEHSDIGSGVQKVVIQQNDNLPIDVGINTSYKFSGFLNGLQRLRVTVFDFAQNNLTRELTFKVDHSPPTILITSPSSAEVLFIRDVEIVWTGSDNENGSGLDHFEIKLNTDDYIHLDKKTKHAFNALAEGKYTAIVRCMDLVGNWNYQAVTFYIDLTGPEVELQKSVDNTTVSGSMVFINWTGKDELSEIAYYEIKLDDGDYLNIGTKNFHSYYNLSKGAHTITIRAVDVGGNARDTTLSFEVDVDTGDIPDKKNDDDVKLDNWFLVGMLILILVVIIIVIGILFFNIRRKCEEEHTTQSYYTYTDDEDEYWSSDEDMYRPEGKRVYDSTARAKGKQTPAGDMEFDYEEEYMQEYSGEEGEEGEEGAEEEYYEDWENLELEDEGYEDIYDKDIESFKPGDKIEFDEDYIETDSEVIDGDFVIVDTDETGEDDEFEAMEEFDEE